MNYSVEDLICGFMSDEDFWNPAVVFDKVVDGRSQFFGRAVDASPKPTFVR
jgi:hypothetical protein